MSLVDELARLEEMRARGSLTEDEFQRAKARLIGEQASPPAAAKAAKSCHCGLDLARCAVSVPLGPASGS